MRAATTVIAILAIGLGTTATGVAAATRKPVPPPVVAKATARFAAIDSNRNGSIDTTEWAATGAPSNSFDVVDRNDNGSIGVLELVRVVFARIVAKRR